MTPKIQARIVRLPIQAILSPFTRFAHLESSSGILLLATTLAALVWANSPWAHNYHALWKTPLTVGFGRFLVSFSRHDWIDDGLMSIFFFLVGLEIKREILIGELSSLKQALFPLSAAVGGTVVPALIYFAVNGAGPGQRGWGIPMATDIAFALGVLASLGDRVPLGLKVFVAALAIVDDIIAVLVIAIFYSGQIRFTSLATGLAAILASFVGNLLGIRKPVFYAVIGIAAWGAILDSGVHATIAGVLLAFTIPARTYIEKEEFLQRSRSLLNTLELTPLHSADEHAAIHTLEQQCELAESPLHRIEHALQPWVSFFVMPLFAFANAGVQVVGKVGSAMKNPIVMGVFLGLVLGKPLGITLFSFMAAKTNVAIPPAGIPWFKIFGASVVCGIGFTMSLFIATLAFGEGEGLDMAKVGILAASVVSASLGVFFLRRGTRTDSSRPT